MSPQEPAPSRAENPSITFVSLVADLQHVVVELSVAVRSHLGEMQRIPRQGKHHQEAHRQAVALTGRNVSTATDKLNEAFGAMRDESRRLAQLLSRMEDRSTNP